MSPARSLEAWLERLLDGHPLTRQELLAETWDALRELGVPCSAVAPEVLALPQPLERLNANRIRALVQTPAIGVEVRVLSESTNLELGARFRHRHALLAECQHGGRGRLGRRWLSPPGAGLWFSWGYRFARAGADLGALAPAVGVALARVLALPGLKLKWPNDLVVEGRKLGGILIEARSAGQVRDVVVGVGLNLHLPYHDCAGPDQPWTDLHRIESTPPRRNALAAALIRALDGACQAFERSGFASFDGDWRRLDALAGCPVRVERPPDAALEGVAAGLAADGRLRVIDAAGTEHLLSAGEVRVRAC